MFWVGGYFNLPDIDWTNSGITGHNYLKSINENFIDTFNDTGLRQTVVVPTRGENVLDLFLTNCPDLITSSATDSGVGDHEAVRTYPSIRRSTNRQTKLWKKADIAGLQANFIPRNPQSN